VVPLCVTPSTIVLTFLKSLFNRPLNQDQFADMVLTSLQRQWPGRTFVLDKEKFQINEAGGMMIYLRNIYMDYRQANPADRKQQLDRFVRGLAPTDIALEEFDAVKERLLPVLRNLCGMDLLRIDAGDDKLLSEMCSYRPLSDELGIVLAIDSELNIRQIGSDALTQWGKTFDDVLQVAIDNLRHKAAPSFQEITRGLFVSQYGDYYDAPRMLVPELIWQLPVGARPVVMAPNRCCLLVCSADDANALSSMVDHARHMLLEESRPLNAEMFMLTAKGWNTWLPSGEPGQKLGRLQREIIANDYADQKQALDALHEKVERDVFVASQSLIERKSDGQLISYAVLGNGVHTLLPKADLIFLVEEEGGDALMVTMAEFLEIAATFVKRLSYVMPRYEVVEFPDAGCLAALRERAISIDAVRV
jgi:hypothetical protein